MKETELNIIHACNLKVKSNTLHSIFAPNDYIYVLPNESDFFKFGKTIYQAEKERSEWIRKYENVLQGLNYWKQRALNK